MFGPFIVRSEDLAYRHLPGGFLVATLYSPVGPGPFPAVVEVHGGAWFDYDRSRNHKLCNYLAASGIIVMSLDFRAPPNRYPASVTDVNAGIRWLKRHISAFGGHPNHIGGIGSSSGGHLILLNGLCPTASLYCDDNCEPDASLKAIVTCWPIVDPAARYRMALEQDIPKLVAAHDRYWPSYAEMEKGSPQRIIDEARFTCLPPLLIVQGTADRNMRQSMIDRFATSYHAQGGSCAVERYRDEPHDFFIGHPDSPATSAAIARIIAFIKANCG